MLDAAILHEFACRCAEEALKLVVNPDPRSMAAIAAKRAWLRGEITDDELLVAWVDAKTAADAIWADTDAAAWTDTDTDTAYAADAAADVAAAWTDATRSATYAADAIWTARDKQMEILKEIVGVLSTGE